MTNDTARFDKSALKLRRIVHSPCYLSGHLSSVRKKFTRIRSDRESYAREFSSVSAPGFEACANSLRPPDWLVHTVYLTIPLSFHLIGSDGAKCDRLSCTDNVDLRSGLPNRTRNGSRPFAMTAAAAAASACFCSDAASTRQLIRRRMTLHRLWKSLQPQSPEGSIDPKRCWQFCALSNAIYLRGSM